MSSLSLTKTVVLELPTKFRETYPLLTFSLLSWKDDHPSLVYYWNQLVHWLNEFYQTIHLSISQTISYDRTLYLNAPQGMNTPEGSKLVVLMPLPPMCTSVDLSFNRVIDLNPANSHLQRINLQYNQIEVLNSVQLPVLRCLDLSHNSISTVTKNLVCSQFLLQLDLSYNNIQHLPILNHKNTMVLYTNNPVYHEHRKILNVDTIDPSWCYEELTDKLNLNIFNLQPSELKDCVSKQAYNTMYDNLQHSLERQGQVITELYSQIQIMSNDHTRLIQRWNYTEKEEEEEEYRHKKKKKKNKQKKRMMLTTTTTTMTTSEDDTSCSSSDVMMPILPDSNSNVDPYSFEPCFQIDF